MNDAHLHLALNHFPIIGTLFGIGILITGLILKNDSVKNTAYVLFIIAAIFGAFSMATGEGAEEIVEDFPGIGKAIIHEHEELAEKFALVLYFVGGLSLVALVLNFKNNAKEKLFSFFILGVNLLSLFLMQKVALSGGEIRHTEIRDVNTVIENINESGTQQKK